MKASAKCLIQDLLQDAIRFEERLSTFYERAGELVPSERTRALLNTIAEDEIHHRNRIRRLLNGEPNETIDTGRMSPEAMKLITDHKSLPEIPDNMNFVDILLAAMTIEENLNLLYAFLAKKSKIASIKRTLKILGQEELKHKTKIEIDFNRTLYS